MVEFASRSLADLNAPVPPVNLFLSSGMDQDFLGLVGNPLTSASNNASIVASLGFMPGAIQNGESPSLMISRVLFSNSELAARHLRETQEHEAEAAKEREAKLLERKKGGGIDSDEHQRFLSREELVAQTEREAKEKREQREAAAAEKVAGKSRSGSDDTLGAAALGGVVAFEAAKPSFGGRFSSIDLSGLHKTEHLVSGGVDTTAMLGNTAPAFVPVAQAQGMVLAA